MATNIPQPKSYEQIQSGLLSTYASKVGINDFSVGSAVTSMFETVALYTARASGDIFQILRDYSVDRATGDALKRLAKENNVTPVTAKSASGTVSVIDTTFVKISTKIYAGANPPNIGSTAILVSDASLFPATGSIYIGRGTNNIEGPLPYSSIVQNGTIYTINLVNPTTKFHNIGETVVLAQGGNRSVAINTIVVSPALGASPDIQFNTTAQAVILDGETQVDNIPVTAQIPGSAGNVPAGAIKKFSSDPFAGATVKNLSAYYTGRDTETDDQLRVRIKLALASTGLGTATAIKAAVIGASPSDEQATVVSDSIQNDSNGATLYIDDGSGYEEKTKGVGLESIVDNALGGEQFFQLATGGRQAPVAKAFLISNLSAPFDVKGGDSLAIIVGNVFYEHNFADTDFLSPGAATAYELTASINANTTIGFEATTSGGGQYLVLRAKAETNDSLQIADITTSGRDVALQIGLPSSQAQTLRLYKNKIPLSKDGNVASVFSQDQSLWSNSIVTGDTLILSVDSTSFITYTITDADFIATGLYNSVSFTNSLESWVQVFNAKFVGITASISGQQLALTSNLDASNRAKIVIDPSSTLVSKGMFSSLLGLSSTGSASDFTLSRNTAQIELTAPLAEGDTLAAGTESTEATLSSSQISGGSVSFSSDAYIWLLVDNIGSQIIPTGVAANTLLTITKPATNIVRFTSSVSNAFANVLPGDYIIIWSPEVPASDRLEGRVHAKTGTTIDILVTAAEYAAATAVAGVIYSDGFVILRSSLAPQKFKIPAGIQPLDTIATVLEQQTDELIFSVVEEQYLDIRTNTRNTSGSLMYVTGDTQGKLLGFVPGTTSNSRDSLVAFYDTQDFEASFPLFIHAMIASGVAADPIDSYIASFTSSISLAGRDPNELVAMLHPYGSVGDAQPYGEYVQEEAITGAVIDITENPRLRRLRVVDRYFLANPLDFGYQDTAVVIVDNDSTSKSFTIPFYRRATTNTTQVSNPFNFNAYDVDAGAAATFPSSFGTSFDFSNFKVLMQAKKVLKPTPTKTAILYRSVPWGRSGEKVNVGYIYPTVPNSPIESTVVVTSTVDIRISLKSGAAVPSSIDSTTEWNVSITPNTPVAGTDQVTYTWSGAGTDPALGLSGGEYVNIGNQTELSPENTGVFKISTQGGFTPTPTSFTVVRPTGAAISESDKATLAPNAITFYQASATTAAEIQAYVTANLQKYVTATLVNDGGTDGSGVILLSTYDDSAFAYDSVFLLDGINWLASSNISGSPQFSFKVALNLPTDVGYAFNDDEEVRFIPTTMEQVYRLLSILAVTGFTTVGTIRLVNRGTRLELATDTLGSSGSIQIIGGAANQYSVPILDSGSRLDNTYMQASVNSIAGQSILSGQWFKLEALNTQKKSTLFSSNTTVSLVPATPTAGNAKVVLGGRQLNQRYFGKPRNHVRSRGRNFRVEKQGSLVCLSWDNVGSSPNFNLASVNFNSSGGGTLNVSMVSGTNDVEYIILTGAANFSEMSIGDLITITGLPVAANNGAFLVTGVSDDGKTIRVLNPNAQNEYSSGTFTFSGNSTAGDQFTIGATNLIAGTNFAIGATQQDTAVNLAAVIGTLSGTSAVANGSVVTVTATAPAANIALAYSGTPVVVVSNATLVGDAYNAGTFSASTSVSEGDTLVLDSPFSILNQGKFRVIRRYNDSVWYENINAVEEEVTLPNNYISLDYDGTTSFKVSATNNSQYLTWNGTGTEPNLQNAQMGDVVTFGTDFLSANRGEFMVLRSGIKLQQIVQFLMPSGAQFTGSAPGQYFNLNSAGNVNLYYVWFNVNGTNTDPAVGGRTGVEINILSGDTQTQVATKAAAVLNVTTGLTANSLGNVLTVTTTGFQETLEPVNVNMPAAFIINVTQLGRRTFLECINPSAVNESTVLITNVLNDHRPQMQFSEYEATVAGDSFVATGNSLGLSNAGSYVISQVIDRENAIIIGNVAAVDGASLNGQETAVYVEEEHPYVGYKQVYLVASQQGANSRNVIVFNSNAQYEKINQSAGVEVVSLSKMNFNTAIKNGLDSYSYNTGLIAEANRITYGDPRDPSSYPGVSAAGAEIFIKAPLIKRITLALVIRTATGVPFSQAVNQVRSTISSLINSNPVGQAIAISAIVAAVNSIPGITAVAISSPQYDTTHDIINLTAKEKAKILDPVSDISVSLNGT